MIPAFVLMDSAYLKADRGGGGGFGTDDPHAMIAIELCFLLGTLNGWCLCFSLDSLSSKDPV
jgi:hypothetical protein